MHSVSIVVAAYNQERTILQTLDSTLTSGVPDAEVIICDDASTDGTRGAIDAWRVKNQGSNTRVTRIFHDRNLGICRNLKSGCLAARGRYVKMIGGDDQILPGALAMMIRRMEEEKATVAFGRPVYLVEDESFRRGNGSYKAMLRNFAVFDRLSVHAQFRALLKINRIFSPCAIVERTSLLEMLPSIEPYVMLEDWPLWLAFARSGVRIRYFEVDFVTYRVHPNNISRGSRHSLQRSAYGADISRLLVANSRLMPFWRVRDEIEMHLSHVSLKRDFCLESAASLLVKISLLRVLRKILTAVAWASTGGHA